MEGTILHWELSGNTLDLFPENTQTAPGKLLRKENILLTDLAGLRFNVVTFCSIVAGAWVAVLSLNTHCQPIEHNETVCTQALSDDMPSMHQPNLQPLLPYKMHLLYVIMLFEAHRQQDINSTSVFGQLIPSVHSTALCYRSLHRRNLCQVHTTDAVSDVGSSKNKAIHYSIRVNKSKTSDTEGFIIHLKEFLKHHVFRRGK